MLFLQRKFLLMNIKLIAVSPTAAAYLREGIASYVSRLQHYIKFEYLEIAPVKKTKSISQSELKLIEGKALLKYINPSSVVILLDEKGREHSSLEFSEFIQKQMNSGIKNIVFIVGGAFGFSDEVYKRANQKLSLSRMTFSHQMVRLFFVEQLYRAFTIIKGEPYHHE